MKPWKRDQKRLQAELHALRGFVEARLGEVKAEVQRLMATYSKVAARMNGTVAPVATKVAEKVTAKVAPVKAKAVRNGKRAASKVAGAASDAVGALESAFNEHAEKRGLATAGAQRDQLLRSLIPLYLARGVKGIEVNSGAISRFWKARGVKYAGPNAAKALREKPGHAKKAGGGWAITDAGVKYVESALSRSS